MRIRTQFVITMLMFGIVLVGIAASAIVTSQQVGAATEQLKLANSVAQGANELGYLSNDYLIYRESQQLSRWQSRFASFSADVARLRADTPEQQALVRNIQASQRRMKEVFDSTVSAVRRLLSGFGCSHRPGVPSGFMESNGGPKSGARLGCFSPVAVATRPGGRDATNEHDHYSRNDGRVRRISPRQLLYRPAAPAAVDSGVAGGHTGHRLGQPRLRHRRAATRRNRRIGPRLQ